MPLDESRDDVADTALEFDDDLPAGDEPDAAAADEDDADDGNLDDLDPAVKERVDKYYTRQQEQRREKWRALGLDLNQDGQPLIADAAKVAQWAGNLVASAPSPRAAEPASPAPSPAGAAPVEEEVFDPLAADAAAYERFAERIAERTAQKTAAPLLAEIERLRGLQQRRAESEAMTSLRDTVRQRIPEIEGALEHPDFEPLYRDAIAKVSAEQLADPATVASIAGWVRSNLDPARMPARKVDPRTASLAQNLANRETLGQTTSGRGGGGAAPRQEAGRDDDAWGVRFLGRMRDQMPDRQAQRVEVSSEAWKELGEHQDYDSWLAARNERHDRERRSGARRR